MHKLSKWISGGTALAVLTIAAAAGMAQDPKPAEKHVKDQAEYDMFNAVKMDMAQNNGGKMVQDLDAWKQKYPDSEFKNDRELLYVQAYNLAKQYDKALDKSKELMGTDLNAMFPGTEQKQILTLYFSAVTAGLQYPNATPEQLATAVDASHKILDYKQTPPGVAADAWAPAKKQLDTAADAMLYRAAVMPAAQAQQKSDWPAAETAWKAASTQFPDKSAIPYNLGVVLQKQHKDDLALWEFARAVTLDPTLGGTAKAADVTGFLAKYYRGVHGGDDGLDQLEQQAKASAEPPAGFHVQTAMEIAEAKEKEFETSHPDIALWMKLKATLNSDQGPQYFDSSMKGAEVPELTGTVLESKCRSKELQVAVPLPDATGAPVPEITLKLTNAAGAASPLTGKAETGRITFKAVADSFTKDPFMLTMTIDKKDIQDLKVTPCAAAPAHKTVGKKK